MRGGRSGDRSYREENLIERSRKLGAVMLQRLREMQKRHEVIGDVRGSGGLFAVVELVKNRETRESLAPLALRPSLPGPDSLPRRANGGFRSQFAVISSFSRRRS